MEWGVTMLKGQDIVVLAVMMDGSGQAASYAEIGKRACISASEAHASVRRLREASLIEANRRVVKRNAMEFLEHGLRYSFPFRRLGTISRGIPTSYAAPVAVGAFAVSGNSPVWQSHDGPAYGQAVEPLYATAPKAASKDRRLYDCLALFDMMRGGRLREREFAKAKMEELIA